MKLLLILVFSLLLISCPEPRPGEPSMEKTVWRGTQSGLTIQTVVTKTYDKNGAKLDRTVEKFTFNRTTREWVPLGTPRRLNEADTKREIENLSKYKGALSAVPFTANTITPHYLYLANNAGQSSIIVLNPDSLQEVTRIPSDNFISSLGASSDGLFIAFAASTGTGSQLRLVDVTTNTVIRTLNLPNGSITRGIAFSADNNRIYLGDETLGIHVLGTNPLALLQTLPRPSNLGRLIDTSISPDFESLLVRGNNALALFDIPTQSWAQVGASGSLILSGEEPCVFHSYGHEFYCSTINGIGIFDTATMTGIATVALPRGEILLRYLPFEGGEFLLVTTDKAVRLIDPVTRTIVATLNPKSPDITFTSAFPVSVF